MTHTHNLRQLVQQLLPNNKPTRSRSSVRKAHAELIKGGWMGENSIPNMLIKAYGESHHLHQAYHLFKELGRAKRRDNISWSTILTCFNKHSLPHISLSLFPQMSLHDSLLPDPFTLSALLTSASLLPSSLPLGHQLHAFSITSSSASSSSSSSSSSDTVLQSSLLHMYSKCSSPFYASSISPFILTSSLTTPSLTSLLHSFARSGLPLHALHLFDLLPLPSPYSLAALLSGLLHSHHPLPALRLLSSSLSRAPTLSSLLDPHVLSSALAASSSLHSLLLGRQLHCVSLLMGFLSSLFVGNALVDMYSKCSDVEGARRVFGETADRDVVSWTSVIVGLARHGEGEEAIAMYEGMVGEGVVPNEVTFVGLMYACSHAGLVEEGRRFFFSMVREYGMRPSLWHYTCYMDMLCRYGHLEEAEGVLRSMPMEPDDAVWACFLSACRCHGNREVAGRIEELFLRWKKGRCGGGCSSSYVLLSNVYADAAMWEKVARTRVLMAGLGFTKQHGRSSLVSLERPQSTS